MTDGDAHPLAINDIHAIHARGGDFDDALGALIRKRHNTLTEDKLDDSFECHGTSNVPFYSVNHCVGWSGITAVFVLEGDALRLLSVVAFDSFIEEAMSASALNEALRLAHERV